MATRCNYTKKNGEKCKANSIAGSDCCFFHAAPENASRAGKMSGQKKKFQGVALPGMVTLKRPLDVMAWREFLFEKVLSGELPPPVANSACYILNAWAADFEKHLLGERVEELERLVGANGN